MASPLIRTTLFLLVLTCILPPPSLVRAAPGQKESDTRLPRLVVTEIKTDNRHGRTVLSLTISQETTTPHTLEVPILIRTGVGDIRFDRTLSASRNDLSFVLPDPPLAVVLDPDQVVSRKLDPTEIPPTWSRFLKAEDKTVVLASAQARDIFAPLLDALPGKKVRVVSAQEIKNAELSQSTLLFLGADNAAARTLFAGRRSPSAGFSLDVRRNPLNQGSVAVLVSSSSRQETEAAMRQLPQYTDSSFLHFKEGRLLEKRTIKSTRGQVYILEELPAGAPTAAVSNFAGIIDRLAASRVVYAGETHTSVADHHLQLRIIQALYKKNPHLAIGMEMFPRASQNALDAYIAGDMDEGDFLSKSRYFQVWGYDWRLFRDTFNFARTNRIPVIGLNLDHRIVSRVFKSGSTDSLSPEEKQAFPIDRDLDLPGYADRLRQMYDTHHEKDGVGSVSGFIQAQGLWDETMAQTIAAYLARNPAVHMVVLAGIEHTRKDTGIPPRVARRLAVNQSSVFNILSENAPADGADIANIADFFFMEPPDSLPPAAKLGLVLEEATGEKQLLITGLSPHGKAGEAGLREKDILLAIDGHPVYTMSDVRIAMIDILQGDTVTVKIRRSNAPQQEQEMEFSLIARTLSGGKPHP